MKVQILWVPPAERRFGSGDILTADQLKEFGVSAQDLLDAGEAQVIEAPARPAAKRGKSDRGGA